ncbi:hypothetical protein OG453_02330 [Streptomyces sp. NBC_01381]|uniref:hypothetical protein n=1 Tax=Streptomyces sp. NBC_01381 TaxID=2903845 RepID=UPI00225A415C|nr:hypothetical protein [Streptomyces sp. NBC_01381]MCX4665519.1 hypothetical protein [Streptomyces sp. NBC_01381]
MAKTGYGKRLADDEEPYSEADFAHLGTREAELATFIDHLEDGAAMGYKDLAAAHPRYGQQAIRTSLRRLTEAGHLRWVKEHLTVEDNSMRWVTRTYWSRIPRSEEWWADFVRARHGRDVTHDHHPGLARTSEPTPEPPESEAAPAAENTTPAYRTLAQLRTADPRMALSEGECKQLEPRAAEWLARGATPQDITRALTEGLPPTVTNPGGLARTRLESKMPPKPNPKTRARVHVTRAVMVCGFCEEPETTAELVHGICADCRAECDAFEAEEARLGIQIGYVPDTFLTRPRTAAPVMDVTERVAELRRAAGLPTARGGV